MLFRSYVFSLVVNDGLVSSTPSYTAVTASAANLAPVAVAGSDRSAAIAQPVTLNGGGSSDPNGDALAYFWDFGDDSPPVNAPSVTHQWSRAGWYVVRCVVSDMKGGTLALQRLVLWIPPANV